MIPNQAQLHHPPLLTKGHQPPFLVVTSGVTTDAYRVRASNAAHTSQVQDSLTAWN